MLWAADLARAINGASHSITLTALSAQPPRHHKADDFGRLWSAIIAAPTRGASVVFILPFPSPSHPATSLNQTAARQIADAGGTCILVPSTNLLHAKTAVIDRTQAWVGSGNFTAAAAHHNRECWLNTTDPAAVAAVIALHDFLRSATIEIHKPDNPA